MNLLYSMKACVAKRADSESANEGKNGQKTYWKIDADI